MHLFVWIKACTRPAQIQPDKISVLWGESIHKVSPLTKPLSATDTCQEWHGQINQTPGQASCPAQIRSHVLFCFVCALLLLHFLSFEGFSCMFVFERGKDGRREVEMTWIGREVRKILGERGWEERMGSKYILWKMKKFRNLKTDSIYHTPLEAERKMFVGGAYRYFYEDPY